jgi:hypothetical protein
MICSTLRTIVLLLLGSCFAVPYGLVAQSGATKASLVQGTVLLTRGNGPLPVAGATVALYGDTGITLAVTDRDGKFSFSDVRPPGFYSLQVTHSGLHAERNIVVEAGTVVQATMPLEKPDSNAPKP